MEESEATSTEQTSAPKLREGEKPKENVGCLATVIVSGVISGLLFPPLFYLIGIGLLVFGMESWKEGKKAESIAFLIPSLAVFVGLTYFLFDSLSEPTPAVDWELEEKAEEWLSHPTNEELYNKHMREERAKQSE